MAVPLAASIGVLLRYGLEKYRLSEIYLGEPVTHHAASSKGKRAVARRTSAKKATAKNTPAKTSTARRGSKTGQKKPRVKK